MCSRYVARWGIKRERLMADSRHSPLNDVDVRSRASRVRALILDVDGVLTDGGLHYGPTGEAFKRFDVKDGHGLVLCRLTGLKLGILTARTSDIVAVRARELGFHSVHQGKKDKSAALDVMMFELGVAADELAYMGDDLNDLPVLARVGLAACPADAVAEVRSSAHFVSQSPGGKGAVRELCEFLLKETSRWEAALQHVGLGQR